MPWRRGVEGGLCGKRRLALDLDLGGGLKLGGF